MSTLATSCVFLVALVAFATGLQNARPQTVQVAPIDPTLLTNYSDIISTSNQNTSTLNDTTRGNDYDFQCDGPKYGVNPDLADCEGALRSIQTGSKRIVFGERGPDRPVNTLPLPYRWMGGLLIAYLPYDSFVVNAKS